MCTIMVNYHRGVIREKVPQNSPLPHKKPICICVDQACGDFLRRRWSNFHYGAYPLFDALHCFHWIVGIFGEVIHE